MLLNSNKCVLPNHVGQVTRLRFLILTFSQSKSIAEHLVISSNSYSKTDLSLKKFIHIHQRTRAAER
jgi:hypothetical protein